MRPKLLKGDFIRPVKSPLGIGFGSDSVIHLMVS